MNMNIGTTIKTIQDIMRKDVGVDGDAQRISQLICNGLSGMTNYAIVFVPMVISTSDFDICITCLYENQYPADLSHSGVWIFLSHQGQKPSSGTLRYVVPDGTYDSV
jgi:hypothetical protein